MVKLLNQLAANCNFKNINKKVWLTPNWKDSTSTTILFDKNANLNNVVNCRMQEYPVPTSSSVPRDYKGVVAVHRTFIAGSYLESVKNEVDLVTLMQIPIQTGIVDLINQLGDIQSDQYKVTMEMPDGTFFSELRDGTGYEVRLTVFKV